MQESYGAIAIGTAEKYTDNLCGQCWNCANMVGSKVFRKGRIFVKLPQCKKMDKYMTEVYSIPCECFDER